MSVFRRPKTFRIGPAEKSRWSFRPPRTGPSDPCFSHRKETVTPYWYAITLAIALFVATSIDDFMLLVCLLAGAASRAATVILAKFANASLVVAVAALLAIVAAGTRWGNEMLLGGLPLALGLYRLLQARGAARAAQPVDTQHASGQSFWRAFLVFMAGSADNVAAYVTLFAGRTATVAATSLTTILVMTIALCSAAHLVVNRRWPVSLKTWRLEGLVPYLLIFMGVRSIAAAYL